MNTTKRIINDLNTAKLILCNPQTFTPEMYIKIGQTITDAINLLKEQETIIEQYHKADGFLAIHGWKWKN